MNLRTVFTLAIFMALFGFACTKSANPGTPASVVVVNAIPTSNGLVLLVDNKQPYLYSSTLPIWYGSGALYSPHSGKQTLSITQLTDTAESIFQGSFNLDAGGIYSLFFAGDTAQPDTMLIKDNITNYAADLAGVRFVNLSIGAKSLSVNREGGTPGDIVTLPYKGVSGFETFDAGVNGPGSYNFEISDPATGDILTVFTWSYTNHKNNTVVIAGSPDPNSATPLTVFQVNNF